MKPPRAITFDFWNTLFIPGPGPEGRAARVAALLEVAEADAAAVIRHASALHTAEWRRGRQFGVPGVLEHIARHFGVADGARRAELRAAVETPADLDQIRLVEGAAGVLAGLHASGIGLGVVSDTGWSPGRILRQLMARAGIAGHFQPEALAFSDEAGVPKPDPRIFQRALDGLGVAAGDALHVGDLRFTDVAGARAIGMASVRFRGCQDDLEGGVEADHVIDRLDELLVLLRTAGRGRPASAPSPG